MSTTFPRSRTYGRTKSSWCVVEALRAALYTHALHAGIAASEQLVRAVLDPVRHVGIGRTAVRGVVLEAAILRRIVRRRDHDAVGEVILAAAIVNQNRPRDDRRRSHAVVLLNDGFHAVGRQDLERRALRGRGNRVRILAHVERAIRAVSAPVVANGLRDGQNVRFGEGAAKRRASVSAGSEADHLVGIAQIRPALKILALKPGEVDQHLFRRGLARERRNARAPDVFLRHRAWLHPPNVRLRIRRWYGRSKIFRSPPHSRMAFRAQASGSAYSSPSRSCA